MEYVLLVTYMTGDSRCSWYWFDTLESTRKAFKQFLDHDDVLSVTAVPVPEGAPEVNVSP